MTVPPVHDGPVPPWQNNTLPVGVPTPDEAVTVTLKVTAVPEMLGSALELMAVSVPPPGSGGEAAAVVPSCRTGMAVGATDGQLASWPPVGLAARAATTPDRSEPELVTATPTGTKVKLAVATWPGASVPEVGTATPSAGLPPLKPSGELSVPQVPATT